MPRVSPSRKGIGNVIGASFFIVLLIAALGGTMFLTIRLDGFRTFVNEMDERDRERAQEHLRFILVNVTAAGKLNLTVLNEGPILIKVVNMWIINLTTNTHRNFPQNISILSGETVANLGSTLRVRTGFRHAIWLVSERGNVFSTPWPLTGPFAIPNISNGTLAVNSPVREDKNKKFDKPFDGGNAWIELCNIGGLQLAVTFVSKIVFVNVITNVEYIGLAFQWFHQTSGKGGDISGPITPAPSHDSPPIPLGDCMRIGFTKPQNAFVSPKDIPSGTYRVFLSLVGYDETGAFFMQNIQLTGTTSF